MTKDELIDRVLLLSSHLQMALKEGEKATVVIENVELDVLREVAKELGCVVYEPRDVVPHHYSFYYANHGKTTQNRFIAVEMRTRDYKIETITKFV